MADHEQGKEVADHLAFEPFQRRIVTFAVASRVVSLVIGVAAPRGAPVAGVVVVFAARTIAERIVGLVATNGIEFAAVVLFVPIGDEVVKGKSVMDGNEVDRVVRTPSVVAKEFRRTGEHVAKRELLFPVGWNGVLGGQGVIVVVDESSHHVTETPVPLAPRVTFLIVGLWKTADGVVSDVPGFGDEARVVFLQNLVVDDVLEYGIFDGIEPCVQVGIRVGVGDAKDGRQVKAEPVDVHLFDPEPEVVDDERTEGFGVGAQLVADARLVEIPRLGIVVERGEVVIGGVVEASP